MINKPRPLRLLCDASTDGLGATLEHKQPDGSIRLIVYIRRATLWQRTELDSYKRDASCGLSDTFHRHLFSAFFLMYANHELLQQISKLGESKPRIQRCMELLSDYSYRLSYRRGRGNAKANILCRLPLPPTVEDISGSSALSDPDNLGVYLIRGHAVISPRPVPSQALTWVG